MSEKRRRCPLSLRTTPEVRSALEAAAEASGRSLTQETEFRLERSFEMDALRAIVREEIAAALKAARNPAPPRATALDDAPAGEPFRVTFHPQWRDYLPS